MHATILSSDLIRIISFISDIMEKEKSCLSELDGAIGDGDHGINMAKCFQEVKKTLSDEDKDLGVILKKVSMVILKSLGGATGALYATFFRKASQEVMGKEEIGIEDLIKMLETAEAGIQQLGKAQLGDKTMIDTINPAINALRKAYEEGKSLVVALAQFGEAAKKGAESTRNMISKIGRSGRLGERTLGYQDPGATSCYFILNAFYEAMK